MVARAVQARAISLHHRALADGEKDNPRIILWQNPI